MNILKSKNARDFLKEEAFRMAKRIFVLYGVVFIGMKGVAMIQDAKVDESEGISYVQTTPKTTSFTGNEDPVAIDRPDGIEIPKLSLQAPLWFVQSVNPQDFQEPLKKGVAHFPSALPGERGDAVILGHSAPPGWPRINYDWVFSKLNTLETGDEVYIIYNKKRYVYHVEGKMVLGAGQAEPNFATEQSPSKLVLITCWPPGINNKRMAVYASLAHE